MASDVNAEGILSNWVWIKVQEQVLSDYPTSTLQYDFGLLIKTTFQQEIFEESFYAVFSLLMVASNFYFIKSKSPFTFQIINWDKHL